MFKALGGKPSKREPLVDIFETTDEIFLTFEIPGIDRDTIDIACSEESIEVKAEIKTSEDIAHTLRERGNEGFERQVSIPTRIDPAKAKARYTDGLLEIRIPKVVIPRDIPVKVESVKVEY